RLLPIPRKHYTIQNSKIPPAQPKVSPICNPSPTPTFPRHRLPLLLELARFLSLTGSVNWSHGDCVGINPHK
ncbi:hypothetical protein AKJ16_DCAP04312, partial [Drosera capensis]